MLCWRSSPFDCSLLLFVCVKAYAAVIPILLTGVSVFSFASLGVCPPLFVCCALTLFLAFSGLV